ncbi:hypothetical protein C8R48DRAFT_768101 [Suillus tomentosus]|nr:hypothetical protein C8R48DRAFT_768101 [Suillus tomentosus]
MTILEHKCSGWRVAAYTREGLHPVYRLFWADLPHANIFASVMPDILHQLHKKVFHNHLLKWCTDIVGEAQIDEQYRTMTNYPSLCYFSKGIFLVSQWTGTEHCEMQRVFLSVLAGAVQPLVFHAARAVLDFIFYTQFHSHTSQTLDMLQNALDKFHAHKHIFKDLRVHDDFNIPKLHSMLHYVDSIKSCSSADGFNTEFPEHLHIDFAKNAYHATNKQDYVVQMTKWLMRQEMVDQFSTYLDWHLERFEELQTGGDEEDEDNENDGLNDETTSIQPANNNSQPSN